MKHSVCVPAYAKLNLYLDVLGKRPDGYHELFTLFERIDLADELQVERRLSGGLHFECDHPELVRDPSSNLVVRAVHAYQAASGWREGLRISLKKRIPIAAGLGGGSSDAAATLGALQRLNPDPLPPESLKACARALGADVPFFLAEVPWALGRGRGDEIEPMPFSARIWHLLVTPDVACPTAHVYNAWPLPAGSPHPLTGPKPDATLLLRALREQRVAKVNRLLFNALEPTVEALYPAIQAVKAALRAVSDEWRPCISGSGSTVFSVVDSRDEAETAARRLSADWPQWRLFSVSTKA